MNECMETVLHKTPPTTKPQTNELSYLDWICFHSICTLTNPHTTHTRTDALSNGECKCKSDNTLYTRTCIYYV